MKNKAILKCLFVLFLAIIPSIFVSFMVFQNKDGYAFFKYYNFNLGFNSALSWLISAFQYSFPILCLMYLTNESFNDFGFNKISVKELCKSLLRLLGLTILFIISLSIIILILTVIVFIIKDPKIIENFDYKNIYPLEKDTNISSLLINIIPIILMAFSEELCYRSYLYTNLNKIIDNKWICIIIVNILFGIAHIYQGIFAVFGAFVIGIIFSIEFKKHNNIYTISIFHALRNIIAFFIKVFVSSSVAIF